METSPTAGVTADLAARLTGLTLRDEQRLRRRYERLRHLPRGKRDTQLTELATEVGRAETRVARRRDSVPSITYPPNLPVAARRDDIAAAIRDHQVVIVAGETGSGKTTQIPKICLELGRGVRGVIGHTQPRRIAARTVADRIAEELSTPLGATVGYKVRFTDKVAEHTNVKLMTDGVLLAEMQRDRDLLAYDTLIIDEAHERSLNIDFILGYIKQLLPRRPDLKVVITSATIDPERFSRHFDDAPIVEVSGRTYPVEVRYRPVVDPDDPASDPDRDQVTAICDAVAELVDEGPGDILVFLSGEREIRDTAEALRRLHLGPTKSFEVLPLYARLSAAEQHRVFEAHSGRRIVLATNVAETSLTVPGIHYVVDPGTARMSRYSHRLKVQRLPIEPISQASANQRAGRCGRTADGICIRLYTEADFGSRPEFTEPEILRTNLASVVLQMTALGLGDIDAFPFVEPPDRRQVADGVALLEELGAFDGDTVDPQRRLTPVGRQLAQLPIDPRLARMVVAADKEGCLADVLVIAAALSIQDPRERPTEQQQAADQQHARFADRTSDFLSLLNLWNYLEEQQDALSSSRFRKLCRAEFLNYLRVREWQDLRAQLRQASKSLGFVPNTTPAEPDRVHQALLAGLLSHVGMYDGEKRDYLGARGARFAIFRGSALARKPPAWAMAAELVETSRLWGRTAARIDPVWVEALAGHLVKRSYSEPHWERRRGAVLAYERVMLYGIPIVARRRVTYGGIDPVVSRELFVRHALVEGDWDTRHRFFHDNRMLIGQVEELEHRVRRRDIRVDDETLFAFYDERIPAGVVSARHFDSWWKKASRSQPDLLTMTAELLTTAGSAAVSVDDYPDEWVQGDLRLPITYQFEPGADADGVTVHIPLELLNQVEDVGFDWQIPGLREELVTALIRALPKAIRRSYVPAPNYAKAIVDRVAPSDGPLLDVMVREMRRMGGATVTRDDFDLERVPAHLRLTFRVIGAGGKVLAESKDLEALREQLRPRLQAEITSAAADLERGGLRSWTIGSLPTTFEMRRGAHVVRAYPSLVDEGDTVAVRLLDTPTEQQRAMRLGTRRLLLLDLPSPVTHVAGRLSTPSKLVLSSNPHGGVAALLADCVACAVDKLVADAGGPVWDAESYAKLRDRVRADLHDATADVVAKVERVLAAWQRVEAGLSSTTSLTLLPALADVRQQVASLVHAGFVSEVGWPRLPDLVRYLRAAERRLERLPTNVNRDRELMLSVHELTSEYADAVAALPADRRDSAEALDIRWMLEELRVSYFAQTVGTAHPVSDKRIRRALAAL